MISYLSGTVHNSKSPFITLLVNGIGFQVAVPSRYHYATGTKANLEIYCHFTQDQGLSFFGFESIDERQIFAAVVSCSGCGPKLGLAVLGALTPSLFVSAVLTNDVRTLSSIDGIGPKKAESIILQLKDKIAKLALTHSVSPESKSAQNLKQLSEALQSLGYSRNEITMALETLKDDGALEAVAFDELFRKSLSALAKKL